MSDLLTIGASGVRAYQAALTTTSENIANAGTDGYSRRTAELGEVATAGSYRNAAPLAGAGVVVSGISRAADGFRSNDVRVAGADLSRTQTGISWLERIDGALTGAELSDRLTGFFNSAQSLAADPSSTALRATTLDAAQGAADAFSATGRALDAAASELDDSTALAVGQLNQLTDGLARINASLGRTSAGNSGQAQLLDDRDRMLEQMSALVDVHVSIDGFGRAAVRGGGAQGPVLVAGQTASAVAYSSNDEGAVAFSVTRDGSRSALSAGGGALAGMADGAKRIADARSALDGIATGFVDGVNQVQASGVDLSGDAGAALFAKGEGTGEIAVALGDPAGIAAAQPGGGTRDNRNLAALAALRTSGGFEDDVTTLVTANGTALGGRRSVADAQGTIRDQAVQARDQVSGVDLDQEAVDLLRFQQAYQASSRVIQVARDTLQSLLNIG